MRLADHVLRVDPPPLTPLMERAAQMRAEGREIFVMAQAMVDYPPPAIFTQFLQEGLAPGDLRFHRYAPDPGIPELRGALARYLAESFGIEAEPHREILVTPGANHAAFTAFSVLLGPGDEAVLVSPYYFNHQMTIQLLGAETRLVQAPAERGFVPRVEDVLGAWTPQTRVLTLVNPNNPTGACYTGNWLRELAHGLEEDDRWRQVWILSDQTYQELYFTNERPLSLARFPGLRGRCITVGSFSKSFGLAGWRLGFLTAPTAFVDQALKIQDSSVVCAPHLAQWALARTLEEGSECERYFEEKRTLLAGRRDALLAPLTGDKRVDIATPGGACFAFLGLPEGVHAERFAWDLLAATGVVTVSGLPFGRDWSRYLRLSFGTGTVSQLEKAARRILEFLTQWQP